MTPDLASACGNITRLLIVEFWSKTLARKATPNFEQALSDLEQLVEAMEQGDLSLEESLKQFETGIALASSCQQSLQKAEQKVEQLIEKNGELLTKDFDSE